MASNPTDNRRNWLAIIVIASLIVLLWDDGPHLFHFGLNVPFWPLATVVFAIWWMSGGKHRLRSEDDCEEATVVDPVEPG